MAEKNFQKNNNKEFIERELNDYVQGEYDDLGFFNTPNGSFWDPDGVYFNRDGFDKHGGYYDDNNVYQPGEGWDEVNNRYFDEPDDYDDEYGSDHDNYDEDDGFGDIDMDKIQDEEKFITNMNDIEIEHEDPGKHTYIPQNEVEVEQQNNIDNKEKKEEKKEDKKEEKEEPKKPSNLTLLFEQMDKEKKKKQKKKKRKLQRRKLIKKKVILKKIQKSEKIHFI